MNLTGNGTLKAQTVCANVWAQRLMKQNLNFSLHVTCRYLKHHQQRRKKMRRRKVKMKLGTECKQTRKKRLPIWVSFQQQHFIFSFVITSFAPISAHAHTHTHTDWQLMQFLHPSFHLYQRLCISFFPFQTTSTWATAVMAIAVTAAAAAAAAANKLPTNCA